MLSIVFLIPPLLEPFILLILGALLFLAGLGLFLSYIDYIKPRYVVLTDRYIEFPQGIKSGDPLRLYLFHIKRLYVPRLDNNLTIYYQNEEKNKEQKCIIEREWMTPEDFQTVQKFLIENVKLDS